LPARGFRRKIRTGDILRGLKGGYFEMTLLSPVPTDAANQIEASAENDQIAMSNACVAVSRGEDPYAAPMCIAAAANPI
jgi:hypothetical protein